MILSALENFVRLKQLKVRGTDSIIRLNQGASGDLFSGVSTKGSAWCASCTGVPRHTMAQHNYIFRQKINWSSLIIKLAIVAMLVVVIEKTIGLITRSSYHAPSLTLLLAIYCGVRWGGDVGALCGFLLGMLMGLLRFEPLGATAIIGTIIGYASGYFYGKLLVGQYLALMIIVGMMGLLAEILMGLMTLVLYGTFDAIDLVWVGLNMVASLPLFYVCEYLMRPRQKSRYLMNLK